MQIPLLLLRMAHKIALVTLISGDGFWIFRSQKTLNKLSLQELVASSLLHDFFFLVLKDKESE